MVMMLHSIDTKCILSALIINILRVFPFSVNIKSPTAVDSALYKSEVCNACSFYFLLHYIVNASIMKFTWIIVFLAATAADVNSILNNSFGLRWLLSVSTEESKLKEERPLCLTQRCKYLAKSLRESMNESVNPCEDFYEYSCGNWPKHNPLPVDENRWNFLLKAERKVDDRLKEIMEEETKPDDLRATKFAKMAFKACLDTDEIERIGLQPLVSTMWRTGGWPLIMEKDEWDQEIYKWQIVDDYYARLTGLNSFHDVQVPMRYLIYNKRSRLFVDTPRLSAKVDRLLDFDEIYVASSEEDDHEEGSQEPGSEEWPRSKEDDEFKILEKKIDKNNINNRTIHRERISEKIKTMKKHVIEIQLTEGTKGAIMQARVDNKRRYVERIVKSWEHELIYKSDSVGKSTETNSGKNHERIEDTNNDLYFDDDDNESEGMSADQGEYNSGGKIDENDEENDNSNNAASGSGSGDHEWDDEGGNGSGDYERDDEDNSGSGSGDYKDNDNENKDDDDSDNIDNYDETNKKDMEMENKRKMYAEYILNVSIALSEARGVSIPRERLLEDIGDLLKFQIRLLTYIHKYKKALTAELKALQNRYDALKARTENGKINWITKIKDVFATGGMEIPDDYVLTSADGYIKALTKLLDRTPSRIIVNYIHWNFLSKVIHATTKKMRELYYNWDGKVPIRRTNYCIEEMNAVNILGYEYVKRYLPEEVLQAASDTVNDVQREVEYRVRNSTWVDIEVGDIILDKLIYTKKQIEYLKSYRNITIMKEHFRGLSASKSHFENMLSIMRYEKWRNLKTLFSENDTSEAFEERTSDNFNPLLVNTMFSPWQNSIQITTANFQQLLFDFRQPWYTSYGIIGLVMSHQINHGFIGFIDRIFDKDDDITVWSRKMKDAYRKRAQCFKDQFTRYGVLEKKVGDFTPQNYGLQTSDENIADTMALNSAFQAYKRRLRECGKSDVMLPGLEHMSNEQLFFLSFANLWCEVIKPDKLKEEIRDDLRRPGLLRVIASMSNSKDFAEAYNCPLNSPMNPTEKCSIWE